MHAMQPSTTCITNMVQDEPTELYFPKVLVDFGGPPQTISEYLTFDYSAPSKESTFSEILINF